MEFKWETCATLSPNYNLYCSFFDHIPSKDDFKALEPMQINCEGFELNQESTGTTDHYFSCGLIEKEIDAFTDKISIGTPALDPANWSLKEGEDLDKYEIYGDMRFEWQTCQTEVTLYRVSCQFFDKIPTAADFDKSENMELECGGWPLSILYSNNVNQHYFGCLTWRLSDKATEDMRYIEAPIIDLENAAIAENDNKYTVSGQIKYKWDNCKADSSNYQYSCQLFDSIPNSWSFSSTSNDEINCDGNNLELTSTSLQNGYLGCAILRKGNNDILHLTYKSLRSVNIQDITFYQQDGKVNTNGIIKYEWPECESEHDNYRIYASCFDHEPTAEDNFGDAIEISCEGNKARYGSEKCQYFGVLLKRQDSDVIYDLESIKLPCILYFIF